MGRARIVSIAETMMALTIVCGCGSQEKLGLTQAAPHEDAVIGRYRPTADTMKLFSGVTHGGLPLGYLDLRGDHRFALVDFPDMWQTGYLSSCSRSHIECGTGVWALRRGDDGWEISLHFDAQEHALDGCEEKYCGKSVVLISLSGQRRPYRMLHLLYDPDSPRYFRLELTGEQVGAWSPDISTLVKKRGLIPR